MVGKAKDLLFVDPGRLVDGDLELFLVATHPGNPRLGWVPWYEFAMCPVGCPERHMGAISLRVGHTPHILFYAGHIGYHVLPPYRGHHYAARSCRLLFPLARAHRLNPLWITCDPDNWASRRSCELAGGTLVEIVDVPPADPLYWQGSRQKCRYRFDL